MACALSGTAERLFSMLTWRGVSAANTGLHQPRELLPKWAAEPHAWLRGQTMRAGINDTRCRCMFAGKKGWNNCVANDVYYVLTENMRNFGRRRI